MIFRLLKIKNLKNWFELDKPTFFWRAAITVGIGLLIIDLTTKKLFDISHWENVLVEAHGMWLDIVLFGVLTAIFEVLTERKNEINREENEKRLEIKRMKEEIEDFKNWGSEEALNRIVGSIRRLNRLGITELDIFEGRLSGADFTNANLEGSKLSQCEMKNCLFDKVKMRNTNIEMSDFEGSRFVMADIQGSQIYGANFEKTLFRTALLCNSRLSNANFSEADLGGSHLSMSECRGTDFRKSDLRGVDFTGCDLRGAKFRGTRISIGTKFENCKVWSKGWIEELKNEKIENFNLLEEQYFVDERQMTDEGERETSIYLPYFLVKKKPEIKEKEGKQVYAKEDKTDDVPKA